MDKPNRIAAFMMAEFDRLPAEVRALANEQGDRIVFEFHNRRKDQRALLRKLLFEIENG